MKAQNLAIRIPKRKNCDKNCPYCVSKMTGFLEPNSTLFFRNIKKVKTMAKSSNISNVLITGKGEPTLEWALLMRVIDEFSEFPLELQTNGKYLYNHLSNVVTLATHGLNVLAISIDNPEDMVRYIPLVKTAQDNGMLVRYTLNLTDYISNKKIDFSDLFFICKQVKIDQFSIREVSIPSNAVETGESKNAQNWIFQHVNPQFVDEINKQMKKEISERGRFLMALPYGAKMYDLDGVSVTWFDYCVQDNNNSDDVRSIIYQEDGHLYFAWNSKASRII